jgi:hypothetical protein
MPFDSLLILRDGTVDLDPNEVVAISTTRNADGSVVLDLKETGVKGLAAVMILPTAPTTYADTLTVHIQESDALAGSYVTIASFPVLYTYVRKIPASASVAAAVEADIGQVLTGGTTGDTGVIIAIDNSLFTLNGTGYIYVAMAGADDLFDNTSEAITSASTFSGVVNGAASTTSVEHGAPNTYIVRFSSTKRYIRGSYTVSAGGNFKKAFVGLTPWAFDRL